MDDFLNGLNSSPPGKEEEVFNELISKALNSKQSDFRFIRS
jgi:hypothetical protein